MRDVTVVHIYVITCAATGKVYVGQTGRSITERLGGHVAAAIRWGAKTHIANAIRKYGPDAFSIQLIEDCAVADANERERFHIAERLANDRTVGYNMSEGGDGGNNSLSEEVRQKISRTKSGQSTGPLSESTKIKIGLANKGKRRTPEQKERIRTSRSYGPLSAEHREKISAGLRRVAVFKLSEADREAVRRRLENESDVRLASAFGVSRKTIWRIRREADIHTHRGTTA